MEHTSLCCKASVDCAKYIVEVWRLDNLWCRDHWFKISWGQPGRCCIHSVTTAEMSAEPISCISLQAFNGIMSSYQLYYS